MLSRVSSLHFSRVSRCLFSFSASDMDLYGMRARTGQLGVVTRASNTTALDRNGSARVVTYNLPAVQMYDLNADSIREAPSLLAAADRIAFPTLIAVRAFTIYVRFIEIDTVTHAADGLLYLGNDAVSGARIYIDASGSFYRLTHHNGTSALVATLGTAPSAGNLVELVGTLNSNGSIQLSQYINEGAPTTVSDATAHTPAAAWGSPQFVRLNSTGSAGNLGNSAFFDVRIVAGVGYDIHQLREFV